MRVHGPTGPVVRDHLVHLVSQRLVDDRVMLAGIGVALMHSDVAIDLVVQGLEQRGLIVRPAGFGQDREHVQLSDHLCRGAGPSVRGEYRPHRFGLGRIHDQLAVLHVVAERHWPAHPDILLARGDGLVADPLANHPTLELGKAEQDVQRQPPHRRGGVEGLGDRNEGDAVLVEYPDQFGEIHQRAAETVDLVDDDVDQPVLDVDDQVLQRGHFQGEADVIVFVAQADPALGLLAGDIGLTGLPRLLNSMSSPSSLDLRG